VERGRKTNVVMVALALAAPPLAHAADPATPEEVSLQPVYECSDVGNKLEEAEKDLDNLRALRDADELDTAWEIAVNRFVDLTKCKMLGTKKLALRASLRAAEVEEEWVQALGRRVVVAQERLDAGPYKPNVRLTMETHLLTLKNFLSTLKLLARQQYIAALWEARVQGDEDVAFTCEAALARLDVEGKVKQAPVKK
jgi:hypothetical protein